MKSFGFLRCFENGFQKVRILRTGLSEFCGGALFTSMICEVFQIDFFIRKVISEGNSVQWPLFYGGQFIEWEYVGLQYGAAIEVYG